MWLCITLIWISPEIRSIFSVYQYFHVLWCFMINQHDCKRKIKSAVSVVLYKKFYLLMKTFSTDEFVLFVSKYEWIVISLCVSLPVAISFGSSRSRLSLKLWNCFKNIFCSTRWETVFEISVCQDWFALSMSNCIEKLFLAEYLFHIHIVLYNQQKQAPLSKITKRKREILGH